MNPYEPPKGDVEPPIQITPAPKKPERDDRWQYALALAAIGFAILSRLAWERRMDWPEAVPGFACLLGGLNLLWRYRRSAIRDRHSPAC